jgi:hypothetical protein
MAFNYSPKVVTDGLVLYLDAANPNSYVSGSNTWRDISRAGNNGILTNGPTYNSANGGSIVFDGVNDRVTLNSNFSGSVNNNVTVEALIWLNATQNTKIFTSNYTQVIAPTGFGLGISDSNNNIVKWFTGNLGTTNTIFSTTTLLNQQYYHAVGTYDGSVKRLYINGILESSSSISNGINNTSTSGSIGYVQNLNAQYFNGRIACTRVYNRALSAQEILQNYNATKTRFGLT